MATSASDSRSEERYDLIVIGGGSAGYAGASLAARHGLRTAVVEGGEQIGGLCILKGCMPSKTLLASAELFAAIQKSAELGIQAQAQGLDMPFIQARKKILVEEFASYRRGQLASGKFDFIRGCARFIDSHRISVNGGEQGREQILESRFFLIATGSQTYIPDIPGLRAITPMDSDRFLEMERLPESVAILGGGAIALEAATFFSAARVPTCLLQRSSRILKEADPEVSEALCDSLRSRGVTVYTGVRLQSFERTESGARRVHYTLQDRAEEQSLVSAEVLCAMGRVPNTAALGLPAARVLLESGRIAVSEFQQTSQPHIFAAGDVSGPVAVVHLAIAESEVAVRNMVTLMRGRDEPLERMDYRLKMLAVFSEPGFAMIGLTQAEANRTGHAVLVSSYPYADHGKAMLAGHTEGFVKLIVDAHSREILGASVVGAQATELIHEISVAMHFRATAGDLARVPHYHPTLSEIWTYPAEELA